MKNNKNIINNSNIYKVYGKRLFDFVFALLGLFITTPFFLLIALAIKIDSQGPVFFKQSRIGHKGNIFQIIKFRTMVVGAEQMGTGLSIRSLTDSRITRVGNLLRKSSLDELPQLLNILKGEMSFVGPRPPATYYPYKGYDEYPEGAKIRFEIRPGVTGLAQVVHRNNVSWEERFILDIKYFHTISFFEDIRLISITLIKILRRESVYGEKFLK